MQTYTFCVNPEDAHKRLDLFLAQMVPLCPSRVFVQEMIRQGQVRVNGLVPKNHYKIHAQDRIDVCVQDAPSSETIPEDIPLDIFYEDSDLLIINKPSGLAVHPGAGRQQGTLVNALLFHHKELSALEGQVGRPGIVHRLDQETSGLMVVAKNNRAHVRLAKQFEQRTIQKCYVALVEGMVAFDEGIVNAPLGADPHHREKRSVFTRTPKEAQTIYRVGKRTPQASLLFLMPKTGRMHQLRVHMAHIGHPILGDKKYGKGHSFSRLALHAKSLGFYHPTTRSWVEYSTPLPAEFVI